MSDKVHVIGHRNPDADAICSAIGYAAYKNAQGHLEYVAARCGNSNTRIDTILKRFKTPLPEFIGDVTPRVRDVMVEKVLKIHPETICSEALEIIDQNDVRVLPVVDHDNKLLGQISIFDLGEYFIPKPRHERQMRHVYTSINNIVRALKAKVIHLHEPEKAEDLFVRVGAMDIRSFGRYYVDDANLARSSVIVVGDRYDIQQRSIQSGVRVLVVSGNLPVEEDVIRMAKERNVSLIISPDDSATTSWIIRSAGQVDLLLNKEMTILTPDERLSGVRRKLAATRNPACMVVNENNELIGVLTRTDLIKPIKTKLALVDHNELTQAVPGADQVNILEIIDHHRLGNPPTQQPINFINAPVGSTSTIIADLFCKNKVELDPQIAGILMSGIISDTLHLKGPTTTEIDCEILEWLAEIASVDANELAELIFSSGSVIKSLSPAEVIKSDMKIYEENDFRFSVSQVEELGFDNLWSNRKALDEALCQVQEDEKLLFSALLVTDINSQNSLLLMRGDQGILDLVTYPHHAGEDLFELNNVVSRKKQLIPYLTTILGQFVQST